MSNYQSSNPYDATNGSFDELQAGTGMTGLTKFIFVMFIVFGLLGIPGGLFGLFQTVSLATSSAVVVHDSDFNDAFDDEAADPNAGQGSDAETTSDGAGGVFSEDVQVKQKPQNPFDDEKFTKALLENATAEAFPGAYVVQIVLILISLLASIAMLIGGIFGLKGSLFGLNLVCRTAGFMAFFKVLETSVGSYIAVKQFGTMIDSFEDTMEAQGNQPVDASGVMQLFLYIGVGLGVAVALMLAIFYLFVFFHTSKQKVRANFH